MNSKLNQRGKRGDDKLVSVSTTWDTARDQRRQDCRSWADREAKHK